MSSFREAQQEKRLRKKKPISHNDSKFIFMSIMIIAIIAYILIAGSMIK